MNNTIHNIIVAGTGGQGVFTLSNFIRTLAIRKGFACEGATFKGGAQRMGTIYSELRILTGADQSLIFSSQVPRGAAHLLIGLEPWETLRFSDFCNPATRVIANANVEVLYTARNATKKLMDPLEALERQFKNLVLKDYSFIAENENDAYRHVNVLMLREAILLECLPFTLAEMEAII
jgi:Pyruvate/2-oxoacid:ferredoxin oxidoreductase gamma subunit